MIPRARVYANLATLANALVGVGALVYTIYGNPLWAMLLIVSGLGFDGLDGYLTRRARLPPSTFGRVADSLADAITFGLAPGLLLAYHTADAGAWTAWAPWTYLVGLLVASLAIARLTYYTLYAHDRPHFVGAPSPQAALAIVLAVLWFDVPALGGLRPAFALCLAGAAGLAMVAPVRFPKIRRGTALRYPMTVAGVAFVGCLLPLQFRPAVGTPLYWFAYGMALVAAAGSLAYYLIGPFTLGREPATPAREGSDA